MRFCATRGEVSLCHFSSFRRDVYHPTDLDLSAGTPTLAPRGLASLFAAPVHLLKEMAHDADERRCEGAQKQHEGDHAPERAVGRQSGLKAGGNERHARREDGEETERT